MDIKTCGELLATFLCGIAFGIAVFVATCEALFGDGCDCEVCKGANKL